MNDEIHDIISNCLLVTSHQFSKIVPTVHFIFFEFDFYDYCFLSIQFLLSKLNFCHFASKNGSLWMFSASFFFCLDQIFKNKWTLKNWLKSHRFDVQSSIWLKAFCHALLSFYTWKKKYLTMWFWTLNLRSRILGYQVKKKLLIE